MKNVTQTKDEYLMQGIYFAPEYEQENLILTNFRKENENLNSEQTSELINILNNSQNWNEKFFVADLLYLYENLSSEFIEPLLKNAIKYEDPSFNRIFLYPAIRNFGF